MSELTTKADILNWFCNSCYDSKKVCKPDEGCAKYLELSALVDACCRVGENMKQEQRKGNV